MRGDVLQGTPCYRDRKGVEPTDGVGDDLKEGIRRRQTIAPAERQIDGGGP